MFRPHFSSVFFLLFISIFIFSSWNLTYGQTDTLAAVSEDASMVITFDDYNPSDKINDGRVTAYIIGGKAPYTYKWSKKEVSLTSERAEGLT